jgi:8-oxo-dGTP pyrophosphatase MutT (NUDIX family)
VINFKKGQSSDGREMHYSVGILLKCKNKYFLMERKNPPPGFACPAGHIDEGEEKPKQAALRELKEETGIIAKDLEFLCEEEIPWNYCKFVVPVHYWYLFRLEVESENAIAEKEEAKSSGWYSVEEIKKIQLEKVWLYWFKKFNII